LCTPGQMGRTPAVSAGCAVGFEGLSDMVGMRARGKREPEDAGKWGNTGMHVILASSVAGCKSVGTKGTSA
jgi:hypothetical protein